MRLNVGYLESLVGDVDAVDGTVYQRALSVDGQERIMQWTMEMAETAGGLSVAAWLAFLNRATDLSSAQSLDL